MICHFSESLEIGLWSCCIRICCFCPLCRIWTYFETSPLEKQKHVNQNIMSTKNMIVKEFSNLFLLVWLSHPNCGYFQFKALQANCWSKCQPPPPLFFFRTLLLLSLSTTLAHPINKQFFVCNGNLIPLTFCPAEGSDSNKSEEIKRTDTVKDKRR